MNRKDFIKTSALATTAMFLPRFLKASADNLITNRRLVVIQLTGGNDALNTIIPYNNDIYYNLRPTIGLRENDVLQITENAGLNASLKSLHRFYHDGFLGIYNSVGYPEPDRSHFRAMDIWQSASGSDQFINTGWIGRYLDQMKDPTPYAAIEADDTLSLALKGEIYNGLAVNNPERLFRKLNEGYFKSISAGEHHHPKAAYLYKTLSDTISSADYIYSKSRIYKSKNTYPAGEFGRNLKTIAELINSGSSTNVYYAGISGFDTHIQQKGRQEQAFKNVDESLNVFVDDLRQNGTFNDTLIMIFSEFGRRVKQNASQGTDHGKAGTLFLVSGSLKEHGLLNALPDLNDLDDGDVKYTVDFRNIYSTILLKWLDTAPEKVIPGYKSAILDFI